MKTKNEDEKLTARRRNATAIFRNAREIYGKRYEEFTKTLPKFPH